MIINRGKPVFLSYRRELDKGHVGRLSDELKKSYGNIVFRDVDAIRAGQDWKDVILGQLTQNTKVLVVIISKKWLTTIRQKIEETKSNDDSEIDYVLLEIDTAKENNVFVIPVFLDGVEINESDYQDIDEIKWLFSRQAYHLSDVQGRWRKDCNTLVQEIGERASLRNIKYLKMFSLVLLTCLLASIWVYNNLIVNSRLLEEAETAIGLGHYTIARDSLKNVDVNKLSKKSNSKYESLIGHYESASGNYEKAAEHFKKARLGETDEDKARAYRFEEGVALTAAGYLNTDDSLLQQAKDIFEELLASENHPNNKSDLKIKIESELARTYVALSEFNRKAHYLELATEIVSKYEDYSFSNRCFDLQIRSIHALIHFGYGKYEDAVNENSFILDNMEKCDDTTINLSRVIRDLGSAQLRIGQQNDNAAYLEEARSSFERSASLVDPKLNYRDWSKSKDSEALALAFIGRIQKDPVKKLELLTQSVTTHRNVVEMNKNESNESLLAKYEFNYGTALFLLAENANSQERLEDAIRVFDSVNERISRNRNPEFWAYNQHLIGVSYKNKAEITKSNEDYSNSEDAFKQALKVIIPPNGTQQEVAQSMWAITNYQLALLYKDWGISLKIMENLESAKMYLELLRQATGNSQFDLVLEEVNIALAAGQYR